MLDYIKGTLAESAPDRCTVEVQGFGYLVHIPVSTYSELPQIGEKIHLYLYEQIREDTHKLFGFFKKEEREIFTSIINVSGIGPKIALALIGHIGIADLSFAIQGGDSTSLSKVPGIGKKTAERLIVEMRGKLKNLSLSADTTSSAPPVLIQDAVSALVNLGYNAMQAQKAVRKVLPEGEEMPLARLITTALQEL